MNKKIIFLLLLNLLLINNNIVNASIFSLSINNGDPVYNGLTSFIYSNKSNSIPHTSPGDGKSIITFDGTITISGDILSSNGDGVPYINLLVYRGSENEFIGNNICCTDDLVKEGQCKFGTIYIQDSIYTIDSSNSNYTLIKNSRSNIDGSGGVVIDDSGSHIYGYAIVPKVNGPFNINLPTFITQTGLYSALLTNCTASTIAKFKVEGEISFLNPYGYLAGDKFPFLYFNLILSAFYVGLFIMWAVLFFKFKNTALRIQYWISLVILLGFLEAMTNYFTLSSINKTGHFSSAGVFFVTIFGTLKSGFSRALVVLVSLGYGVVVPRLPKPTILKLGGITITYLIVKGIQNYTYNAPVQTNGTQISFIYLTLPVSILDTLFYWWILTSLTEIMSSLETKNQTAKLLMFRKFIYSLLASAVCSFIILFVEVTVSWATSYEYATKTAWIVEVLWGISYFAVLVAICWIWKPNSNNQKFAYSELDQQEEEDTNMDSFDGLTHRGGGNNNNNNNNNSNKNIDSSIINNNDNTLESIDDDDNINSFSIQDDEFEDQELKEKVDIVNMFKKI